MNRFFIILILILLKSLHLYAQVEVGSYPIDLDRDMKLHYSVDFVDKSLIEQRGTHLEWNLPETKSPLMKTISITKGENIAQFEGEVIIVNSGDFTVYLQKKKNSVSEVGFAFKPASGYWHTVKYQKPVYFSTKNMMYGAMFSDSTSFDLILEREELPPEILEALPSFVKKIKLVGELKRWYHFDAQGRFVLEDKKVAALRLKVKQNLRLRIYDVRSGDEIPVTNLASYKKIIPQAGNEIYYLYFSNEYKYYYAKISQTDIEDNYIIEYQKDDAEDNAYSLNAGEKIFLLYPNPTFDVSKIFISNYKPGTYSIEIYNIIGKKVKSWKVNIGKQTLLRYNLSFLRKGTYLVALKDKYGNILATRKLIIISV